MNLEVQPPTPIVFEMLGKRAVLIALRNAYVGILNDHETGKRRLPPIHALSLSLAVDNADCALHIGGLSIIDACIQRLLDLGDPEVLNIQDAALDEAFNLAHAKKRAVR